MTSSERVPGLYEYYDYGGWSIQTPDNTLGRYSPPMISREGAYFRLRYWFDRAQYLALREAGADHDTAFSRSLLCPGWAAKRNVEGWGSWWFEMIVDDDPYIELVGMLWPEDDSVWPNGEINIVEGRVGKKMITNLHWGTTQDPQHAPLEYDVDVTKRHMYRVDVEPGRITWWVDGEKIRVLDSPHSPATMKLHFVVQGGVNKEIVSHWNENSFSYDKSILFRPVLTPPTNKFHNWHGSLDGFSTGPAITSKIL